MNAYEIFKRDCCERLVRAAPKECKFGGGHDGVGEYAHILKDAQQRYLLILDERLRSESACKKLFGGKLKFHSYSHYVNSSQMFCLNAFGPLMIGEGRSDRLKAMLRGFGINLRGGVEFADEKGQGTQLEYVVPETGDRTNFDFYVRTTSHEEVFVEVKYTEKNFGRPSLGSRKPYEWIFYKEMCEKSRYLFNYSREDFYENFQVNRNIGHVTKRGLQYVVFLFPYSNPALRFQLEECSRMPRVKVCYSECLTRIADEAFPFDLSLRKYYHNLVQRYFNF